MITYAITWWAGLTRTGLPRAGYVDPFDLRVEGLTFAALVEHLSTHAEVPTKDRAPGWSPYGVMAPRMPCARHKGGLVTTPHRCDACVPAVGLLVYDADQGSLGDVEACRARLMSAGVAQHWYSTYSYAGPGADRTPYRLVIPLTTPVLPADFASVRLGVLRRFLVPADALTSSGLSHFYYVPSCAPGASSDVVTVAGGFLDPAPFVGTPVAGPRPRSPAPDWFPTPDPDPSTPLDLTRYWAKIRERAHALAYKRHPGDRFKAEALGRLLRGEPLASHGHRNTTTTKVAGILAYMFPDAPVAALVAILRPSLARMIAEGSRLTAEEVERMVWSGLYSAAQAKAEKEAFRARVAKLADLYYTPRASEGTDTAAGGTSSTTPAQDHG